MRAPFRPQLQNQHLPIPPLPHHNQYLPTKSLADHHRNELEGWVVTSIHATSLHQRTMEPRQVALTTTTLHIHRRAMLRMGRATDTRVAMELQEANMVKPRIGGWRR